MLDIKCYYAYRVSDDVGYWCTFLEIILLTLTEAIEDTNYYTYYYVK